APHELDDEEALFVPFRRDVVHLDDVRVLQLRDSEGFAREAGRHLAVFPQVSMDDLERDLTTEAQIPRPVDGRHAAVADLLAKLVLVEGALEGGGSVHGEDRDDPTGQDTPSPPAWAPLGSHGIGLRAPSASGPPTGLGRHRMVLVTVNYFDLPELGFHP